MPKNPHPPRGGVSKTPAVDPKEPVIEFGESKKRGKKANPEVKSGAAAGSSGKGKGSGKELDSGTQPDAPKKPDTRTLIGGASWTGKLPVNMLSEHCQKQKWAKPEYTMVRRVSV